MPSGKQHIIQKVNVRLRLSDRERQTGQTERLKNAVQQSVNRLSTVLDKVPGDTMLYIDQVAVQINLSEWDPGLLEERIDAALAEKMSEVIRSGLDKNEAEASGNGALTMKEKNREVIAVFLKTGRVPWWATPQEMALAREYLDDISPSEWMDFMNPLIRNYPSALKRFVSQWPEDSVFGAIKKTVMKRFGSESVISLLNGLLAFDELKLDSDSKNAGIEHRMYEKTIRDLMHSKSELQIAENLIQHWLQISGNDPNQKRKRLYELKKFLNRQKLLTPDFKEVLGKSLSKKMKDDAEGDKDGERVSQTEEESFISDKDESVSVQHAGVVLLHSYLPLLFGRLGYLENGVFRNQAARERAICAIHYMATGESEFSEESLVLAKFLCGWPLGEPINRFLNFSDYEKEECENLLLNVISHWKALKNTSINGLQTSFLQREGILKREAFGYTLYVEELTHDILLQRLPWSFSVVKLSWMSEMLSVEWRVS